MSLAFRDSKGGSLPEQTQRVDTTRWRTVDGSEPELTGAQFPWFALQVHAKHELAVANSLRSRGFDPFLPLYRCRKLWSDRIKVVDAALFPGYMFCRLNLHYRLPVLTAPGVIRIVGHNRLPVPVDEAEIKTIRTVVASGLPNEPWTYLRAGDRVQIKQGPLRGVEGILIETRGAHRLILSVTLLQRSVAVEIDSAFVESLRSPSPPRAQRGILKPTMNNDAEFSASSGSAG
jgi:transcription antitermination factor NusG